MPENAGAGNTRTPQSKRHMTLRFADGKATAECSCGWRGPARRLIEAAREDRNEHRRVIH